VVLRVAPVVPNIRDVTLRRLQPWGTNSPGVGAFFAALARIQQCCHLPRCGGGRHRRRRATSFADEPNGVHQGRHEPRHRPANSRAIRSYRWAPWYSAWGCAWCRLCYALGLCSWSAMPPKRDRSLRNPGDRGCGRHGVRTLNGCRDAFNRGSMRLRGWTNLCQRSRCTLPQACEWHPPVPGVRALTPVRRAADQACEVRLLAQSAHEHRALGGPRQCSCRERVRFKVMRRFANR
jgi:hypothetical protein